MLCALADRVMVPDDTLLRAGPPLASLAVHCLQTGVEADGFAMSSCEQFGAPPG